jgi:gliding motility-associated-like protein
MRITVIFIASLLFSFAKAQTPADWWYFGMTAGVHFTPSGPVADTNSSMSTSEGVATISDAQGNLLFYTDGIQVFNKQHDQMPNGFGLMGNSSSTQSGIIVPRPGNDDLYYVISVQELGYAEGMRYSLVDLTLDGGLGDVDTAQKNIPIIVPTCEKVAAIQHANGVDFWVVTHEFNSDAFHAYLVSSSGINLTPVTSNVGMFLGGSIINTLGYLRFSPSGSKLAAAQHSNNLFELFDFDPATGVVSNGIVVPTSSYAYGIEFSPNEQLVYVAGWNSNAIWQFEISSGIDTVIAATETQIGTAETSVLGALQLGPDNKMYLARHTKQHLGCINDPNVPGLGCNYVDTAVYLLGRLATVGLPTFISSFFNAAFYGDDACFGDTVFFAMDTASIDSAFWDFGDPLSGTANQAVGFNPFHIFTDTGDYAVTLVVYSDTNTDTAINIVHVYPRQTLNLGPSDTLLCQGDTLVLRATELYSTYLWQDGSTADTFLVWEDSLIYVTLDGICDTLSDTIQVRFDFPVPIDLGPDTSFCDGNGIVLDPNVTVNASYGWNTGDSVQVITASQSGNYVFTAINGCGTFSDSIEVTVIPIPADSALLPPDTLNCFDNAIFLARPLNDTITWLWSDGSDDEVFEVDTTMIIWLAASNACGFSVDTFRAVFNGAIKTELGEDTIICSDDSIRLWGSDPGASYQWNTGDTTDTIWSTPGESENYILTITLRQCQSVESRRVYAADTACPELDCTLRYANVFTPNGDGLNDRFRIDSDCDMYSYDMAIYNRWGQMVHYSKNVAYGWDGYINGEPAADGQYFFTVAYKDFVVVDADRFVTRGSFTLVR